MTDWTQRCYSRLLIDNHISEDDPAFMTRFDPRRYVTLVKQAGVEAAMVYACCHNGNCYYPTKVGHMHNNLNRRDIFGETVNLLRQEGITPVAYYTTIYHNHSAKNHPAWRMQDARGRQHEGRYWWSCPNNREYVEFTKAQVSEVIGYDVEGIFVDMTFWPVVCACPNCREKYRARTGREIPETVDWSDPRWIDFQRFREQSMVEFCQELAGCIKSQKDITVTFQNSPIIMGWALGQTPGIADACDYASGDFYGGKYQHVIGAKILAAATKNPPFEFMTSRCVDLHDHTSMKSEAELRCEAATTLASGGAYFFIDAINPDGTLMDAVYERLGRVSSALAPVTAKIKAHRPILLADTGLYFSMASLIDPALNGRRLDELGSSFDYASTPAYLEMLGASMILTRAHRPFRVIRETDGDFSGLKTLILNNVQVMEEEEVERVRAFVKEGGTLIATGLTSLARPDGTGVGDFALADVFGVSYKGEMLRRVNFLAGEDGYVLSNRPAPLVKLAGAQQMMGLAEPLFDPDDAEHYASIHSNPPGRLTGAVGLAVNTYGKGRCVYLAPGLLAMQQDAQQSFGAGLLEKYAPPALVTGTNAPAAVEVTVLKSTTTDALLVGLVNYQKELPNIPARGLWVDLDLVAITRGPRIPRACVRAANGRSVPFHSADGMIRIEVPELETIEMIEVSL